MCAGFFDNFFFLLNRAKLVFHLKNSSPCWKEKEKRGKREREEERKSEREQLENEILFWFV